MTFTLFRLVEELAARHPDRVALIFEDGRTTFAELRHRALQTAMHLASLGVVAGDRVAFLSTNSPTFFDIAVGSSRLGAVLMGVNFRLSRHEVADIVRDSGAAIAVSSEDLAHLFDLAVEGSEVAVHQVDEAWREAVGASAPMPDGGDTGPDDVLFQLYSSGTTGRAKGILLTNSGMEFTRETGRRLYGMDETSVNLLLSPLFHIGGAGYGLSAFSQGGATVLLPDAAPARILDAIERHGVTHLFAVPTVIQSLLDDPAFSEKDLSSLRLVSYGGAPMPEQLLNSAMSGLRCEFMGVYGMTETSGTVTALLPEDHDPVRGRPELLRSIGRGLPWIGDVEVRNPADGTVTDDDVVGEIWVRSGQNTPGYWRQPDETTRTITADGWLRTGDAASRDAQGYLYLRDRLKDMIISGGENIYPAEVENVLAGHPAVQEVAVIGVPSRKWGEEVKALVVTRDGSSLDSATLIAYCRERLATYKCPKSIDFLEELPHNASGKILRRVLRQPYWPEGTRT